MEINHFVTFQPDNDKFTGLLEMETMIDSKEDIQPLLKRASSIYCRSIKKMRLMLEGIESVRSSRQKVSARQIWEFGQAVFKLKNDMEGLSLELNSLYDHLTRDLGVKRKWLEKVIIFRKYIPEKNLIPESLNWGKCEKGTRRTAQKISKGMSPTDDTNDRR